MLQVVMLDKYKKISLWVLGTSAVIMLILLISGVEYYSVLSGSIFLTLWSIDKVVLWFCNQDFGLAVQLTIKKDAPKAIRLVGLAFACFVLYIGVQGVIELVVT